MTNTNNPIDYRMGSYEREFIGVYENIYKNKSVKKNKKALYNNFCQYEEKEKQANKEYIITLRTNNHVYYVYTDINDKNRIDVYFSNGEWACDECLGYFNK